MLTMLSRQKNITRNVCGPAAGGGIIKREEKSRGAYTHIYALFFCAEGGRASSMAFYERGSPAKFPGCTAKALLAFPDLEKNFFSRYFFFRARSPGEITTTTVHSLSLAGTESERGERNDSMREMMDLLFPLFF